MPNAGGLIRGQRPMGAHDRAQVAPLIGESPLMVELRDLVARASASNSNVLLFGERGTRSEAVARAIHDQGARADMDFLSVDCAAAGEGLFAQTEIHPGNLVRGGAIPRAEAQGGTVCLNEVGSLSLELQGRLLAVLQSSQRRAQGDGKGRILGARYIAASSRDLMAMVRDGAFRPDLFFRLDVLRVRVPSLRERRQDIPALVHALLPSLATRLSCRSIPRLTTDALVSLCEPYDWPDNLVELEEILETLMLSGLSPEIDGARVRAAMAWRHRPRDQRNRP